MSYKTPVLLFMIFMLVACHKNQNKPHTVQTSPIFGAWEVTAIRWISKDKTVEIEQPHPGVFIYHKDHYSLSWSPKRTPRTPFINLSEPTEEEILAGFKSIVFNSGSYSIKNNQITATAKVAKVPGFEGGKLFYRFEFKNDNLILTLYDEIYPDGSKPNWSGQWQTEFTLRKAS